jgi:hypothetical protein
MVELAGILNPKFVATKSFDAVEGCRFTVAVEPSVALRLLRLLQLYIPAPVLPVIVPPGCGVVGVNVSLPTFAQFDDGTAEQEP